MRGDCVALEFSVGGEQTIFHSERLGDQLKSANLFVMRQIGVERIEGRLDLFGSHAVAVGSRRGDESCEGTALIADENHVLRFRHARGNRILQRLRRNIVPGIEDD